ncbi:TRAP transporter small permease subunit [Marinoscillum sp. MHG1-6]|uniref:TRAP transporter small permease subunit n=1 Tax=Marinoscillum sp. MHG1-6 TaxID=2959627 RepID=UPI002157A822|nr:TRAP transporter small permease subunit [Marinoscillum sp. MHG1-6]
MRSITTIIDRLNELIGRAVSWLSLVLVILIVADVTLRYLFNWSSPATFELEWHVFAVLFLLAAGWSLQQDRHVRVDVFYQSFSETKKAWVNLLGTMILLVPLCYVGVTEGAQFAYNAYLIGETSTDPGGLPARFIVKSAIPVCFGLLALQAISIVIKSIQTIITGQNEY